MNRHTWIILLIMLALCPTLTCVGQSDSDYSPLATSSDGLDSIQQHLHTNHAQRIALVDAKKQKVLYEALVERFESTQRKMEDGHILSDPQTEAYLSGIMAEIYKGNPSLPANQLRVLLARYPWPNATQVGEGTILLNIGLVKHLDNESQLAFVLCHEIAHFVLNHVDNAIQKRIDVLESEATKKQMEEIQHTQYGARAKAIALLKEVSYDARRHSRSNESQADSLALDLLLHTRFDAREALTCLGILDDIDAEDTSALQLNMVFASKEFPFNKLWLKSETNTFGSTTIASELEEDSLKTHPDCQQRITALVPRLESYQAPTPGKVSTEEFDRLKRICTFEMPWSYYFFDDLGHCLHEAILMHQYFPKNTYFIGVIGVCLNRIHDAQKAHELGKFTTMPDQELPPQYNLILNFIQNLKLSEIARLNYYFLQAQGGAQGGEFQIYAWWKSCVIMGDLEGQTVAKAKYLQSFPDGHFVKLMEAK